MKVIYSLVFLTIALASCLSNSAQNSNGGISISATEYDKLLKEKKNVQLIDVRTPGEFAEDHLPNAINIDYNSPDFKTKIGSLDKSKPTFIYCLSGGRSGSALDYMTSIGYKEVINMKGGIMKWKSANLPVTAAVVSSDWKGMTKDEYAKLIQGDIPVVVDFNAKWCPPCKRMLPILNEIQKEYEGKIKVVAIDYDENKSLAKSMNINDIPLLIYHENGKVVMNQEGELDKAGLIKLFKLK